MAIPLEARVGDPRGTEARVGDPRGTEARVGDPQGTEARVAIPRFCSERLMDENSCADLMRHVDTLCTQSFLQLTDPPKRCAAAYYTACT